MLFNKILFIFISTISLISCNTNSSQDEPIEFEKLIDFNYAKGIKIYKTNEGHVVTISDPVSNKVLDHFLITKNEKTELTNIKTVRTPIDRVLAYSSTYITFLDALDEVEKIKGVTYSQGISNEKIKQQLASDSTIDVGSDQSPNKELIVSLKPDLALIYPSNGSQNWFSSFDIPTITNVEYKEIHPLAQAEWIKLYGILFDKEKTANSLFNKIEYEYHMNRDMDTATHRPIILCGELYDNAWTLPGGKSYINQLIKDAGGIYFLQDDTSSGSRKLDFEYILKNDSIISHWMLLTHNPQKVSLEFLRRNQPRYSYLSVFNSGNVSVCNTAKTPYFETSILEPHLLLKDLKSIIYPSKETDYHYFTPITNE